MKTFNITVETEKETVQTEALVFAVLNGTDVGGMKNLISRSGYQRRAHEHYDR